jgi:hypothetical protein
MAVVQTNGSLVTGSNFGECQTRKCVFFAIKSPGTKWERAKERKKERKKERESTNVMHEVCPHLMARALSGKVAKCCLSSLSKRHLNQVTKRLRLLVDRPSS